MAGLILLDPRVQVPVAPLDLALRMARESAAHKIPLAPEHVAVLLEHTARVTQAATAADRFMRDIQTLARLQPRREARVPERVARGYRNQLRAAVGWPPIHEGET